MKISVRHLFSVFTICLLVIGCSHKNDGYPIEVMKSLDKAGNNRDVLISVLEHYHNDSLKLKAAEYLITNMKGHYGYEGWELDSLNLFLENFDGLNKKFKLDSVDLQKWTGVSFFLLPRKQDLQNIPSKLLISNIDHSFKRWKEKPWNKNLSFEDFCELLLPFCIGDDRLSDWRELYSEKYEKWLDSVYTGTDAVEAARVLCDTILKEGWSYNDQLQTPHRDAVSLLETRVGYNRDWCDRFLYAMRACGIPATIDMALNSQDRNTTYQWIVIRDNKSGSFVPFAIEKMKIDDLEIPDIPWALGKVYRLTYKSQEDRMNKIRDIQSLPMRINNTFLKDVTSDYFGDNEVEVRVRLEPDQKVYLGVWNQGEWRIDDSGNHTTEPVATFTNIEPGVIFVPVKLENDVFVPCGHGFYYGKDSEVHILRPDTLSYETVRLNKIKSVGSLSKDSSEFIKRGVKYELSFLNGSRGWKTIGTKLATGDYLESSAPKNAVLKLRDVTNNTGGQIFRYTDSMQQFSKEIE